MASRSFFLSYKHVNIAHVKTHTDTHTLSQPTPPPSPLVLIIPLQIRRSISSRIIVSPLLTPPPQLLYIQSRERSCPLSPCQPRWPGSSGSHNPSRPIRTPCRCKAQLDDSIPQEERRWIKKKREREGKPIAVINLFRIPLGTDSPGTHPNFMYTYTQHPLTHQPTPPQLLFILLLHL